MAEKRYVEISTGIIFRTVIIIATLWFLYFIRDILALLFIAIVLVAAIDPIVYRMQRRKIPRVLGVAIVYFCLLAAIGLTVSFLVPPLTEQIGEFAQKIPEVAIQIEESFRGVNTFFQTRHIAISTQSLLSDMGKQLADIMGNVFTATVGIFSGFVSVIVVLVVAFYMAIKEDGIKNFIVSITPEKHKEYAGSLELRIQRKIGRWALGQFFLMFVIFTLDYVGLLMLGVPYALLLAFFAGLMEIVPFIGPIVSAIPAVIAGFFISPLTGFLVLLLFFLVQQFENHIIVPQVMKRAVGLNPIAVILALLIGLKLGGIWGAILAIPVATAIGVFVGDLFEKADREKV